MTFQNFLNDFDHPGIIVLLEGKRAVQDQDCEKLQNLGQLITLNSQHMVFRSGNASGSDELFIEGVRRVASERVQLVTPFKGHRTKQSGSLYTYSMEDFNVAEEEDVIYLSKQNKKTKNLIDQYVYGIRNPYTLKASYIIRDTVKVTGVKNQLAPANFAIFYDDLENPETGGTGHTMNVCRLRSIPYINQNIWIEWLNANNL